MPTSERRGTPTRGFLFADLRGYTAYVERHGAHRAAAMLDRYRTLVRAAVADFDGAEIRTEGDSFYVVFDSASSAIECALAITAGASQVADDDPSNAFHVGVGIHAGETVETAEGYVGSAVNTAARICAQAGRNQVLVSGTVRALTAGVVDAVFVPIGRRRLKGLPDPIELFQAQAAGSAAPVARRTMTLPTHLLRMGIGAVAALGLIGLLAVLIFRPDLGLAGGSSPPPSSALPIGAPSSSAMSSLASGSASASASADEFPNEVESELLSLLISESEWDRCERAPESALPVLDMVQIALDRQVLKYRTKMSSRGAILCQLGGINAPDEVLYVRMGYREEGLQWIAEHAPKVDAVEGSCETEENATERWRFGGGSGRLLCYTTATGDAILAWTYDQTNIFGRAVRDDRDANALLGWWMDNARFLPT